MRVISRVFWSGLFKQCAVRQIFFPGKLQNFARFSFLPGCGDELKDGQALMALDKHFHVWCFKCKACGELLHGEYMGKDGAPYCEKCYQNHFGVKCTYCFR